MLVLNLSRLEIKHLRKGSPDTVAELCGSVTLPVSFLVLPFLVLFPGLFKQPFDCTNYLLHL